MRTPGSGIGYNKVLKFYIEILRKSVFKFIHTMNLVGSKEEFEILHRNIYTCNKIHKIFLENDKVTMCRTEMQASACSVYLNLFTLPLTLGVLMGSHGGLKFEHRGIDKIFKRIRNTYKDSRSG